MEIREGILAQVKMGWDSVKRGQGLVFLIHHHVKCSYFVVQELYHRLRLCEYLVQAVL